MVKFRVFDAALRGDDTALLAEFGPAAIVRVAPTLSSVFIVQQDEDGTQRATVAFIQPTGRRAVAELSLPKSFLLTGITEEEDGFVLTAQDGRVVRGMPAQFSVQPRILPAEVNPRHDLQTQEVFLKTHLLRPSSYDPDAQTPTVGAALTGQDAHTVAEAGQAFVTLGEREVWVQFDSAAPPRVIELLPLARTVLSDLDRLAQTAIEYLWDSEDEQEPEPLPDQTHATSVMFYWTGDFELHFEELTDTEYYLDGYWPAVQFTTDLTPVSSSIEA